MKKLMLVFVLLALEGVANAANSVVCVNASGIYLSLSPSEVRDISLRTSDTPVYAVDLKSGQTLYVPKSGCIVEEFDEKLGPSKLFKLMKIGKSYNELTAD